MPGSTTPFITVVMPVKNEAGFIRNTLMQVLRQDYPADRFEVILVDGMSDDGTPEIAAQLAGKYPNVRIMKNERGLPGSGRNIGFQNGRGDIFLVVDGHCHMRGDQLFRNIIRCFEVSNADCLGRPQTLDPPGLNDFQQAVAFARASMLGHTEHSLIYSDYEGYASPVSNGAVYKREVFLKIGYVDEAFDACEDVEFNYRIQKAGMRGYTSPSLSVQYYPREDLAGLFRQMERYGLGRFNLARKHPETFRMETLIPPAFAAGLLLMFLAGLLSILSSVLYGVFVTLYLLYSLYVFMIVAEALRIAFKRGGRYFKHLPFIFFIIHFGLGWGFLRGAARHAGRAFPRGSNWR
ncbi:MAG TPA: glycosyltransferase family 2 protein [Dissulfurispiraceae bacterium]